MMTTSVIYRSIWYYPLASVTLYRWYQVCSLIATCKAQEVTPRDYLNDITEKMPRMKDASREELVGLLPHKWKLQHSTD